MNNSKKKTNETKTDERKKRKGKSKPRSSPANANAAKATKRTIKTFILLKKVPRSVIDRQVRININEGFDRFVTMSRSFRVCVKTSTKQEVNEFLFFFVLTFLFKNVVMVLSSSATSNEVIRKACKAAYEKYDGNDWRLTVVDGKSFTDVRDGDEIVVSKVEKDKGEKRKKEEEEEREEEHGERKRKMDVVSTLRKRTKFLGGRNA